ncbi:ATP-binding protein [Halobacillus seohaensis]|uniref:histidine kinase n=1 Tax=Halobacillus seohaensis TaxID=447421 RepID=A0ABW2ERS7_9BACI
MFRRLQASLRTKILSLILILIIAIIVILSGVFAYWELEQTKENTGQLAKQVATTVSLIPSVREAFETEEPSIVIQPIALGVQEQVGAEFVVVGNEDGVRYAHPDHWKIGNKMVGGDNDRALVDGEYYISESVGTLGPSLRGKAPIFNEENEVIGIVSVGFLIEDINNTFFKKLEDIAGISALVLLIGGLGGLLLTRSIRKDTMGLEPYQIATLYRDREAVLSSIKEGIIAIDRQTRVTMINQSARNILQIEGDVSQKLINDVFPNTEMPRVLHSGKAENDQEILLNDRMVIINRTPIVEKDEVVGVVTIFRDKTEVREMVNSLSEVKRYSEDLRSQTHEYANKMYVLLGLLQLGNYSEAIDLIEAEFQSNQSQTQLLNQVNDDTVKAILLGKLSRASELKIDFSIDEGTSLESVPSHIDRSKLVTILGNMIDNAFEAVQDQEAKQVVFSATDVGREIVFEVTDNGPGISEEVMPYVFVKGFSTKEGKHRGYGLANISEIVSELGGTLEIGGQQDHGTSFSIFLSK